MSDKGHDVKSTDIYDNEHYSLQELKNRERYLTALGICSQLLLEPHREIPFQEYVEVIGTVTNADRLYIYRNTHEKNDLRMIKVAEWCPKGIDRIDLNPGDNVPSYSDNFSRWINILSAGRFIISKVCDLPQSERDVYEPQGTKTLMILPINVEGDFFGFMGIDRCQSDGFPESVEQEFLLTTVGNLTQALRRYMAQEQLRMIQFSVNNASDSIFWADSCGRILYANDKICRSMGYFRRDFYNKYIWEIFRDMDRELWDSYKKRLVHESAITVEVLQRAKDGRFIPTELKLNLLVHDGREFYYAFAHDITERKIAQCKLEETKNLMETIFDGIPDIINIQDMEHNLLKCNKAWHEFYGIKKGEEKTMHCYQALGQNSFCDQCAIGLTYHTNKSEKILRYFEDSDKWFDIRSYPVINPDGQMLRVIEHMRDVTEQKKTIEQLEQARSQANAASRAKSEFLANMSHELRSPLNSLLVFAHDLIENSEGNIRDDQIECIKIIRKNGNDLLSLINDILDLSKIEAGKIQIFPDKVFLDDIKLSLEKTFKHICVKQGLDFEIRFVQDNSMLPEYIVTDSKRLIQILRNLLSNAIKFTESGSVIMEVFRPDKDCTDKYHIGSSNPIAFSVKDTGIGIPEDKLLMVFEAFEQADGSTSRKFGGTGLGLSISSKLSDLLHGRIEVKSKPGQGSTFTLYLPGEIHLPEEKNNSMQENQAQNQNITIHAGELPGRKIPTKSGKILIVDDDPDNVVALTRILSKRGFDIDKAENGKDAVKLLDIEKRPDVILMDIMMPVMDGYETISHIRSIPGGDSIPIIALTAKARQTDRDNCIAAGADDYISKPVDVDELLKRINIFLPDKSA